MSLVYSFASINGYWKLHIEVARISYLGLMYENFICPLVAEILKRSRGNHWQKKKRKYKLKLFLNPLCQLSWERSTIKMMITVYQIKLSHSPRGHRPPDDANQGRNYKIVFSFLSKLFLPNFLQGELWHFGLKFV